MVVSIAEASKKTKSDKYKNIELFSKVLHLVESNYYEEVDTEKLIHGGIKGMLKTLDPHTNFLPPKIFKEFRTETQGKFGGLGIEVTMQDGLLMVVTPIDDTPAMKAGVEAGDKIVKIDGSSTKGLSLQEAVSKMRGKPGSKVKLTVMRPGAKKFIDIDIKRAVIKVRPVKHALMEKGIGYVRLSNFQERSAKEIKNAIKKIEKSGKLKGLILDLRSNPGGLLDQAVDVSNLFVDDGIIVSTRARREDGKEVRYAKKGIARNDFAMAVLVNGSSASASEIVAGALKDHKRAIIMGEKTFGKGSVQTVIEVGKDMGIKLTIAQYYTPLGTSIQAKGIEPDILLSNYDPEKLDEAKIKVKWRREADLEQHLDSDDGSGERKASDKGKNEDDQIAAQKKIRRRFDPKEDYQVQEAVRYLKAYAILSTKNTKEEDKSIAKGVPSDE
jgi:carboxyl-terminal processing protease